jgi:hypothetical protein
MTTRRRAKTLARIDHADPRRDVCSMMKMRRARTMKSRPKLRNLADLRPAKGSTPKTKIRPRSKKAKKKIQISLVDPRPGMYSMPMKTIGRKNRTPRQIFLADLPLIASMPKTANGIRRPRTLAQIGHADPLRVIV